MLKIENLDVYYGDLQALRGISLKVEEGEIVTIIGSNGAGKSTTIKAISGMLKTQKGLISWLNQPINQISTSAIVERGIIQIPEGRQLFPSMSVLENLELGALNPRARKNKKENLKNIFGLFPKLEERKNQSAGTLSGGEQQMLAVGRSLMGNPNLILVDEPTEGLAPLLKKEVRDMLEDISKVGVSILLVEHNLKVAMSLAQRVYVMKKGCVAFAGTVAELAAHDEVREKYLEV